MKTKIICTVLMMLAFAVIAAAEPPENIPPGTDESAPPQQEMVRKKLHERVFRMVAWELADEMNLPSDTEAKFMGVLREYYNEKSELVKDQLNTLKQLKEQTKKSGAGNNGKQLQATLNKLDDTIAKQQKLDEKLNARMKNILTVDQQAKFVIAWVRVQERIQRKLMEERHKRGRSAAGMPGMKGKKMPPQGKPGSPPPPPPVGK
jgi:hypothetical protein